MEIKLNGKNAIVGGSSKGIGRAIAERLANSGANVTIMARNETLLQELTKQLDQSKGQHHQYLVVDFSNFNAFAKKIEAYFKNNTVDILINNTQGPTAGGALEKNLSDTKPPLIYFSNVLFTPTFLHFLICNSKNGDALST